MQSRTGGHPRVRASLLRLLIDTSANKPLSRFCLEERPQSWCTSTGLVVSVGRSFDTSPNKPPPQLCLEERLHVQNRIGSTTTGLAVSARCSFETSKQIAAATTLSGGAPAGAEQNWWTPRHKRSRLRVRLLTDTSPNKPPLPRLRLEERPQVQSLTGGHPTTGFRRLRALQTNRRRRRDSLCLVGSTCRRTCTLSRLTWQSVAHTTGHICSRFYLDYSCL